MGNLDKMICSLYSALCNDDPRPTIMQLSNNQHAEVFLWNWLKNSLTSLWPAADSPEDELFGRCANRSANKKMEQRGIFTQTQAAAALTLCARPECLTGIFSYRKYL